MCDKILNKLIVKLPHKSFLFFSLFQIGLIVTKSKRAEKMTELSGREVIFFS